jgi:calmodulin
LYDDTGKGLISEEDVRKILVNLDENITDEEVEEIIGEAEVDDSGFIDYVKYIIFY